MRTCWTLLLLGVVTCLVGCGEEKGKPGQWVGAEPTQYTITQTRRTQTSMGQGAPTEVVKKVLKPEVPVPKLKTLQVNLPGGWKQQFNELANEWHFDKEIVVSDFGAKRLTRVVAVRSPVEVEPTTLDGWVKFLKERPDEGGFIWPVVDQRDQLPDGFIIIGRCRLATDVTNTDRLDIGFVVIRTIGGDRIRFKCHRVLDLVTQQEAIEMCRGARF